MLLWRTPTTQQISAYLDRASDYPWSYSQIGATRFQPPAGFDHDRRDIEVGRGRRAFVAARQAIQDWAMFPPEMSCVYGTAPSLQPGQVVAVLLNTGLIKALGACRIVYRLDSSESPTEQGGAPGIRAQFGFAYGTLTDHVELGEERFLVSWLDDDRVMYTIESFSRPQHWLAKLGYPYARWQQSRFRRLSTQAMRAAVQAHLAGQRPHRQTWRTLPVAGSTPAVEVARPPSTPLTTRSLVP